MASFALKHLATILIIVILIPSSTLGIARSVDCPANCKCSRILDSLEANCAHSGLVDYPNFDGIPIDHLDLSSNLLTEFPKQYADMQSLVYLDLSGNQITYLDADALMGFDNLRTLLLANNNISQWQHINPNEAFAGADRLARLSLSGNTLNTFTGEDPKLILRSKNLLNLELEQCGITAVGGDVLINGLPNLEELTLSGNNIQRLNALPSKSLRKLDLSNSNLPKITNFLLQSLPTLESLNISWNAAIQFGSGPNDVIVSHSLNELDASFCNLDTINLNGLPALTQLQMRGNVLRSITAATFLNNTQLEIIDVSRNAISLIEVDGFSGLNHLTKLDMSYNEIASLDRNVFRDNDMLVTLNLSRNVFERFSKLFSNSLREINLSWCEIISIDSTAFSGFKVIQSLDFSNNPLRDIPIGMQSETLRLLDVSNCRLSTLRNRTLGGFPELSKLYLRGNRFTNPLQPSLFKSNKYLDAIWVGDNPWICDCHDKTFMDFYDYLTSPPAKLKDRSSARCASPFNFYGLTWETACQSVWLPDAQRTSSGKVWTVIFVLIISIIAIFVIVSCIQKYYRGRQKRRNRREYMQNHEEMMEIRRQNQRMLQEDATPNAPGIYENTLPSYEDAIRMPKLERPVKSMVDLTASARSRKKLQRSCTDPEAPIEDEDNDLMIDHHRFRSEEMLSNRAQERTAQINPCRRTGVRIEHNKSGSRRLSTEDSRFAPAHLKSQNLQSAEQIANFQSYENSPYTKRKAKIAEIPPFRRAQLDAESVEFLTDPEFDAQSKPSSPFAQRKPKTPTSPSIPTPKSTADTTDGMKVEQTIYANISDALPPAVENYFGATQKPKQKPSSTPSSSESNFQMIVEPELASLGDDNITYSSHSDLKEHDTQVRRKKRKNSTSRRASGNFTSAAAAAAAEDTSSSETEPIVVVHKPMRETLF